MARISVTPLDDLFQFEPNKNALLPTLVPADRLVAANSLVGLNQNLGRLAGAPLGGLLLGVGSLPAIVVVDVVTFLAAAAIVAFVRQPRSATAEPVRQTGRAREDGGLRAALAGRMIGGGLIVACLTDAAQGLFVVLFVVFVARVLHGDEAQIGLLRGVQAVGAIASGVVLGTIRKALSPGVLTRQRLDPPWCPAGADVNGGWEF